MQYILETIVMLATYRAATFVLALPVVILVAHLRYVARVNAVLAKAAR